MSYLTRGFLCRGLLAAGALAVAQVAAVSAHAADYDVGAIHISKPWARATPKGASNAAGYLTVTSAATAPDRMICSGSDAAASCHIDSMTMDNGVMKMRAVEGGLEVKPSESISLKPGGFHIMLVDLKHPLEAGKTVEVTLQFEKAGTIKVELPVLAIGAPAPNAEAGGSMGNTMQGGSMMHGGGMQMDKH